MFFKASTYSKGEKQTNEQKNDTAHPNKKGQAVGKLKFSA